MRNRRLALLVFCLLLWATSHTPLWAQSGDCASDVVVERGDTLSGLAIRFFGNVRAYNAIVSATNARAAVDASYARIANPNLLEVGWKLCVPDDPALAPAATATPSATRTPTPALAPGALHPLSIVRMRSQSYPGSEIVVEQVLSPGANYSRAIVSYLSEGNRIYALMTIPEGEKPATGWPVIVFNHGYIPPEQYRTTERYVAYVDAIARSGYIVFRSDYRGHGSSEGEATGGSGSPAYTVDVLNAVAAVKQHPDADPDRIGMWGHSMGGQITLRSMVVRDEIKAGVIWAGTIAAYPELLARWQRRLAEDPSLSALTTGRRWGAELLADYGTPEENPVFWASISPNAYLADLSGPVQLHHGTGDSTVPVEFSATVYDEIQEAGGVVEYYEYAGDDHNISRNFTTAMARSIAFFDRYVKEDGAP